MEAPWVTLAHCALCLNRVQQARTEEKFNNGESNQLME